MMSLPAAAAETRRKRQPHQAGRASRGSGQPPSALRSTWRHFAGGLRPMSRPAPLDQAVPNQLAGTRDPMSNRSAAVSGPVGVDPAVAQEWPVRAGDIHLARSSGTISVSSRRGWPWREFRRKCRPRNFGPRTRCLRRPVLVADAVGHGDIAAVGDGVAALDGFPGRMLVLPKFLFSPDASRWPWDRRGFPRLAAPSAARPRDTTGPNRSARRSRRIASASRNPGRPA